MTCLSKLRRTLDPSVQRGWGGHRAGGWFVSRKRRRSPRKQRIRNAALFGYHKYLKVLLKTRTGSDKRWIDDALITAAKRGESKCVKVLIVAGADVNP